MSHATIRSGTGAFGRFLRLWVLGFCLLSATHVYADTVTPTIDVSTGVVVRASASAQSAAIATLLPGRELELVGSVPYWHEVRLPNGSTGFVSKRWTRVIPTGVPPVGPPPPTAPTFTIDVVDVGTGLAVLVRGPDFALVYDAGSNDDLARGPNNRMLAFIQTAAPTLTTIDHMILSHPHRDHLELLPDLLATYSVRQVWDSGRINDICGYRAFLTAIRDEPGVQYHNALQDFGTRDYPFAAKVNGCYGQAAPAVTVTLTHASRINSEDPIPLGQDASMRILHADGANHPNANENTLVVRLDLGTTRILLVGDAPGGPRANPATPPTVGSIEQVLVTCCANALAQILVVGHHGSNDLVSGGVPRCDRVVDCGCLLRANAIWVRDAARPINRHRAAIARAGLPHRRERRSVCDQSEQDRPGLGWRAGRMHKHPNRLERFGSAAGVGVEFGS